VKYSPTDIPGVWLIELERRADDRGYFARTWCEQEFRKHGLNSAVTQINTAVSTRAGTLRGMHYQEPPDAEVKVVRCVRGALFDVTVDLRADSPTYGRWFGTTLSGANGLALYIPEGCAHGYITLEPDTELTYMASVPYAPKSARGVRFDDPAFGIRWPRAAEVISEQDRTWPEFKGQISMGDN
jgi:dTDP-4-dehydrorhamnose 3,5-epimerase